MGILANENAIGGGNYLIERSLRFQSASSQYLTRTPASAGNRKTWTWSGWVKRGALGQSHGLLAATSGTPISFGFDSSDKFFITISGVGVGTSTAVFRDPSAWYHVVIAFDTTQSPTADRVNIYINNVKQTLSNTLVSLNTDYEINNNTAQQMGTTGVSGSTTYFDGYLTEIHFINGAVLNPSSFGETDALTGVWVAKKYTGTYGTNGFYLKFNDGTSTTTLGTDSSGNANNWTLTNFTRSAGVSDCWMYDVPSGNGSPSATQPSSNYCVLSAIDRLGTTTSGANLNAVYNAGGYAIRGTVAYPSTGKWYYEMTQSGTGDNFIGLSPLSATLSNLSSASTGFYAYYSGAFKYTNGAATSYGATFGNNDVIGVAVDCDAGTVTFYKNNTSQGTAFTGLDFSVGWQPMARVSGSGVTAQANFGQRSFAYTPPSGFKALCTANLPDSTILAGNKYMDATTYSGTSATQNIVNAAGFSPDFVWIKSRSSALASYLSDTVRGAYKVLFSNLTNAEYDGTSFNDGVSTFNSNGFTLLNGSNVGNYNQSGSTYVAWQWDAGTSTVTNTSGSISSQVRANTTAGFSIVTFTSDGTTAGGTVGHGLGVAPKMVIYKGRNTVENWYVYHTSVLATQTMALNTTNAAANSLVYNNTAPTSTVIQLRQSTWGAGNLVAYCWADVSGYSKAFSYTGNGSADGPFVYTGFRPKFMMMKRTDSTGDWYMVDSSRATYNQIGPGLNPNTSSAEFTLGSPTGGALDFLSNGFKWRGTYIDMNANGGTYIGIAFAENPFKNSNAR